MNPTGTASKAEPQGPGCPWPQGHSLPFLPPAGLAELQAGRWDGALPIPQKYPGKQGTGKGAEEAPALLHSGKRRLSLKSALNEAGAAATTGTERPRHSWHTEILKAGSLAPPRVTGIKSHGNPSRPQPREHPGKSHIPAGMLLPGREGPVGAGAGGSSSSLPLESQQKAKEPACSSSESCEKNIRAQIHLFSLFLKPFPASPCSSFSLPGVVAALGGSRCSRGRSRHSTRIPHLKSQPEGPGIPAQHWWGDRTEPPSGGTTENLTASALHPWKRSLEVSQGCPDNPWRNPTPPVPA